MGSEIRRRAKLAILITALFASAEREAAALTHPDQFCTGDPCVIASPKAADPGAVLDFGMRTVVLQSTLELLPLADGAIGSLSIDSGHFSIVGNGQIRGFSTNTPAGTVTVNAVNGIQLDDTLATGAVRLSGRGGGTLTLTTTAGSVTGAGRLALFGDGAQAGAGTLNVTSAADVTLSGKLDIGGAAQGAGGAFNLTAAGNVSLTDIDLSGADGGDLDLTAGGSLTLGAVDLFGTGEDADAGQAFISAGGAVTFLGHFDGRGSDSGASCGDGADVDVSAGGDITIAADMDLQGRGLDCTGGPLVLDGAAVVVQSPVDLAGTGPEGSGGDLDVYASTRIRVADTIALDGGEGGGGDFFFDSVGDVEILADINAQGRTGVSPGGSSSDVQARALTVAADIDTSGGGSSVTGADLTLSACDVVTQPGAHLRSTGSTGSITVVARDSLVLRGRFTAAAAPGNILRYSQRADPPDIAGTIFSPLPTQALDATLVPCRVCEDDADCGDGNACTDDICDQLTTCLHPPRSGPCQDGDPCTSGDTCAAGACVGGPPPTCDDGTPCTFDSCLPMQGCAHTPVPGVCSDGSACTSGDSCSGGACVGTPIDCSDGDPCTDDTCSGGVCGHAFNTAPCADANPCTTNDRCDGGTCEGGPPPDCNDHDGCTADSCQPVTGCANTPIVGCMDSDGDGQPDGVDECSTRSWTLRPTTPPNQHPLDFRFVLARLSAPPSAQTLNLKGLFNVDPSSQEPLDPAANGVHLLLADALGSLIDVNLPAVPGCAPTDGWTTHHAGPYATWQYRNASGAIPPGCAPGSARGIELVQIKDRRSSLKAALQFKIKAKNVPLLRLPTAPLTRLQASLALAAQPAPGTASAQARAGQCAEALFTGNPISSTTRPYCKPKVREGALIGLRCKGE